MQSPFPASPIRRVLAATAVAALLAAANGGLHAQTTGVSATLLWTAPGDDGLSGRATRYDIRYSPNAISGTDTLSWWNGATVVNTSGKVPVASGQLDSMVVTGLTSGVRYYAIVRTADEVPNWSPYSNVAVIDLRDVLPPARIADLRAR
ncbi:MAG TPA: hypothetical protein VFS09_01900 [Candidatus Eisenbacteria bacterium]|nr:hypothetical protein [Candidatus Eisenbacteria bacterium]